MDRCRSEPRAGRLGSMISRERRYAAGRVLYRFLRPYWRVRRGVTLGAQGAVIDDDRRVLLVRHTYKPGWWFPGGGVEPNESIETAVTRELAEEAAIAPTEPPILHGVFTNFTNFSGDHIAVFVVRHWRKVQMPPRQHEIEAVEFFRVDALPVDVNAGTRRRLAEIFDEIERASSW